MLLCNVYLGGAGPDVDPNSTTSWSRPPLKTQPDSSKDAIVFQQIDIDHYIG